jgi:hypothetical protein
MQVTITVVILALVMVPVPPDDTVHVWAVGNAGFVITTTL